MLIYYDSYKDMTPVNMGNDILNMINKTNSDKRQIVILCIGSDRSTGDCLGPLIGYKLKQLQAEYFNVPVFGTLSSPVHAVNLVKTIDIIYDSYDNPYVIAIDASLGRRDHIGFITLGSGALCPGLGVKKELPKVGDMHITGIVNLSGNSADALLLQTTRLSTIMTLADAIAGGLALGLSGSSGIIPNITYQASYRQAL